MNNNEIRNFTKLYKNTVCLDECLQPMKLVDCTEVSSGLVFNIIDVEGKPKELDGASKVIGLKGRLKERDYNFIESAFYRKICPQ